MKVLQVDAPTRLLANGPADPRPAVDLAVKHIQEVIDRKAETLVVLRVGNAEQGYIPTTEYGDRLMHAFAEAMAKFPPISSGAGGEPGAHVEVVMVPYFVDVTAIQIEGEEPGARVVNGLSRTLETEADEDSARAADALATESALADDVLRRM